MLPWIILSPRCHQWSLYVTQTHHATSGLWGVWRGTLFHGNDADDDVFQVTTMFFNHHLRHPNRTTLLHKKTNQVTTMRKKAYRFAISTTHNVSDLPRRNEPGSDEQQTNPEGCFRGCDCPWNHATTWRSPPRIHKLRELCGCHWPNKGLGISWYEAFRF